MFSDSNLDEREPPAIRNEIAETVLCTVEQHFDRVQVFP